MNKKLIFLIATIMVLSFAGFAFAATMTDLNDASWAKDKIEQWVTKGVIKGYPDNTFKPNRSITRAEFVALVNRAFDKKASTVTSNFTDVKTSNWYLADVATAKNEGYIVGYENNTFRPDRSITREEAATIVARLLKLAKVSTVNGFIDNAAIQAWAVDFVNSVVDKKIMQGYPDKTFKPANNITRAESVETLYNALNGAPAVSSGGGGSHNHVTPSADVTLSNTPLGIGKIANVKLTNYPTATQFKLIKDSLELTGFVALDKTVIVLGLAVGDSVTVAIYNGNVFVANEVTTAEAFTVTGDVKVNLTPSLVKIGDSVIGYTAKLTLTGYADATDFEIYKTVNNVDILLLSKTAIAAQSGVFLGVKPYDTIKVKLYKGSDALVTENVTAE